MCLFYNPKADSYQIEVEATNGNYLYAINPYTLTAEGDFTKSTEEEKEVIAILSSFREVS